MRSQATLPLAGTLPDELMEEILLKVAGEMSIASETPAAPTHRLLLRSSNDWKANSIDIEAPLHGGSGKAVFKIPNPSPAPIPKHGRRHRVVGSCRGFILLTAACSGFIYFVMWNPVWPRLPYLCGIGYDSSTDDYVAVTVTFQPRGRGTEFHCFSSGTNSWSCTESTVPYRHLLRNFAHGLLLNGALHWLLYSCDNNCGKIIAFDVTERRLSEIPLPRELQAQFFHCHLRVLRGCLCLCFATPGTTEMWIMKEYKVHSSWTKSFAFSTTTYVPLDDIFLPICFTKNGEILGHDGTKTLVRLNDKGELLERWTHGLFNRIYGILSLPTGTMIGLAFEAD
ncbi:F-box protein CPR30 [Spatholobus suberectus]|nr:F-box protein CPR30 [Spatholobus suberectus]